MICGYHTCHDKNGLDYISEHIPFLSGDGRDQWLTQGYYFWTDSDRWAKIWGHSNIKSGKCTGFVISKFNIDLSSEEILDLVGNAKDEESFKDMISRVKAITSRRREQNQEEKKEIYIADVIDYFRKESETKPNFFPYLGIKTFDIPKSCNDDPLRYTPTRSEEYTFGLRRQLCVFKKARDRIEFIEFTHPKNYVLNSTPRGQNENTIRIARRNFSK